MSRLTQEKRERVLERDERRCQFCGVTEEQHKDEKGRSLDIHHIIPRRAGGSDSPRNLMPVCIECHQTLESTQADAIERLREQMPATDEYKKRIEELDEMLEQARKEREKIDRHLDECLNAVDELIEGKLRTKVYVVHETKITTSELLYVGTDEEDAYERFKESDRHATMETANISVGDWVSGLRDFNLEKAFEESPVLKNAIMDNPSTEVLDE